MADGRPAEGRRLISDESVDLLAPLGADAIAARVPRSPRGRDRSPDHGHHGSRPGDAEGPLATIAAAAEPLGLTMQATSQG